MTAAAGERPIARELGPDVLRAAKEGRARDVLVLLPTDHEDVMRTSDGALFALALAVRIRAGALDSCLRRLTRKRRTPPNCKRKWS